MRRKSERNKSKTSPEKKPESPKKGRRHSKRRKRSTSPSASDDSDEAPLKVKIITAPVPKEVVPTAEPKKSSNSNSEEENQEQPVWKVTSSEGAASGEIQKLKICLTRPPSTPERIEKSPRRRKHKSSTREDSEERPTRRRTRRGVSPTQSAEDTSSQDNSYSQSEKEETITIVKETNEVIISEGKLSSTENQESENTNEIVKNSQKVDEYPDNIKQHQILPDNVPQENKFVIQEQQIDDNSPKKSPNMAEIAEMNSAIESIQQIESQDDYHISEQNVQIVSVIPEKDEVQEQKRESSPVPQQQTPEPPLKEVEPSDSPTKEITPEESKTVEPEIKTEPPGSSETLQHFVNQTLEADQIKAILGISAPEKPDDSIKIEHNKSKHSEENQVKMEVDEAHDENKEQAEIKMETEVPQEEKPMQVAQITEDLTQKEESPKEIEESSTMETETIKEETPMEESTKQIEPSTETEIEKENTSEDSSKTEESPLEKEDSNKQSEETIQESSTEKPDSEEKQDSVKKVDSSVVETVEEDSSKVEESESAKEHSNEDVSASEEVTTENKESSVEVAEKEDSSQEKLVSSIPQEELSKKNQEVVAEKETSGEEHCEEQENTQKLSEEPKMEVEDKNLTSEATESEPQEISSEKTEGHEDQSVEKPNKVDSGEAETPVPEASNEDKDVEKSKEISSKEMASEEKVETVQKVDESPKEQRRVTRMRRNEESPKRRRDSSSEDEPMHDSSFDNSILYPKQKSPSPDTSPSHEETERQEEEPPRRKQKPSWDRSVVAKTDFEIITTETILKLCPEAKMLSIDELRLEIKEEKKPKPVPKLEEIFKPIAKPPMSPKDDEDKDVSNIGLNRKISIVNDEASKLQPPPSPAKNPVSTILFITNLVRPFTLKQLQELLSRTGTIKEDGFWTDRIKSKCYVEYETEEEAEATRNALHGIQWPIGNGKKLIIDFGTVEAMQAARNPIVTETIKPLIEKTEEKEPEAKKDISDRYEKDRSKAPIREWDLGKVPQEDERKHSRSRSRDRDRNRDKENRNRDRSRNERSREREKRRHSSPSNGDVTERKQKKLEEDDVPAKLMDDLFRKTKATPSIYWLPLSPEQIAQKQQERLQRMAEHKRRLEESRSRTNRDFGRGAPRSRRRSGRFDND